MVSWFAEVQQLTLWAVSASPQRAMPHGSKGDGQPTGSIGKGIPQNPTGDTVGMQEGAGLVPRAGRIASPGTKPASDTFPQDFNRVPLLYSPFATQ